MFQFSSFEPTSLSTAPTSILSGNSLQSPPSGPYTPRHSCGEAVSNHEDDEGSVSPSLATVERAAGVKIFLETFYNKSFAYGQSRVMREYELEAWLDRENLLEEGRSTARKRLREVETKNLRRLRALKLQKAHDRRDRSRGLIGNQYEMVRVLGKGSFGIVRLVRATNDEDPEPSSRRPLEKTCCNAQGNGRLDLHRLRNQVFAMKTICKADMLRNCQEGHLRAERDFLVDSARSQWVVPLIESFQDRNHLYLVMEYMVGGDFLSFLLRWEVLSEVDARFYIAEIILCVEEVHKMNWIHRDVKPDNFLISASGHLKISDFGLAFDGQWPHNQSYYNKTRASLLEKSGIRVEGDAQDKAEQLLLLQRNANSASSPKQGLGHVRSDNRRQASRPEGHMLLNQLNTQWQRKVAKSVVGTSQYMAPEVIHGEDYDGRCD
jgi:serine/threonine protein kinase